MEIPHGRELFQFHSLGWPHSLLPKTSDHRKSRGLVSGALGCSLSLGMEDRAVSWDAGFRAKVQGVQTKGTGWSLPAHLSLLVRPVTKTAQSPDEMGWDSAPRHRKDRLAAWKRHFLEGDLSPERWHSLQTPRMPWLGSHHSPISFKDTATGSKRQDLRRKCVGTACSPDLSLGFS